MDSLFKIKHSLVGTTLNFFEAWKSFNKVICAAEKLYRYHFIESLILAQDERWRRA